MSQLEEFRAAQRVFADAAVHLLNVWVELDNAALSMTGTEAYPFEHDFEEVVCRIGNWLEADAT